MNKNEKNYLIIFGGLALLVVGLLYYYLILSKKAPQVSLPTTTTETDEAPPQRRQVVRRSEELPKVQEEEETGKPITVIPVTFVVDSISDTGIVLKKEGGTDADIITYPTNLNIKVRRGVVPPETPSKLSDIDIGTGADLSDITLGQTIKVINYNEGEAIYFYILE